MFSLSWLSVCCTNHESCIGLKWFHCCHYCLSSGFQRTLVFLLKNKVKRLFSVWVTQEDRCCYVPDCQVWYLMDLLWWTRSAVEEIRPRAFQVWGSNFQVWPVCTSHKDPHPQPLTQCPHFHITLLLQSWQDIRVWVSVCLTWNTEVMLAFTWLSYSLWMPHSGFFVATDTNKLNYVDFLVSL